MYPDHCPPFDLRGFERNRPRRHRRPELIRSRQLWPLFPPHRDLSPGAPSSPASGRIDKRHSPLCRPTHFRRGDDGSAPGPPLQSAGLRGSQDAIQRRPPRTVCRNQPQLLLRLCGGEPSHSFCERQSLLGIPRPYRTAGLAGPLASISICFISPGSSLGLSHSHISSPVPGVLPAVCSRPRFVHQWLPHGILPIKKRFRGVPY